MRTGCCCRVAATVAPRISWAPATYPAVHDFLTNPAYAGAFVFGRTRTEKRIDPATGRVISRHAAAAARAVGGADPRSPSRVHLLGRTTRPTPPGCGRTGGHRAATAAAPPREGTALLQGLLRCGRCGRIMQTGYSGPAGNSPRYVCARAQQLYAGEHGCQSIGGGRLEKTVLAELFTVLEPAALSATAQALAEADAHFRQRLAAFELAVERARFEADRARRQFDAVEPENRLVARTLEKRAGRQARRRCAARRTTWPPSGPADRWRSATPNSPGSPRAGADVARGLRRAEHHHGGTQAAHPRGHRRDRPHRRRRTPRIADAADHLAGRCDHRADHADDQEEVDTPAPPARTPST